MPACNCRLPAVLPKAAVTSLCLNHDGALLVGFADNSAMRRIRDGHVEMLPRANAPSSISNLMEDLHGVIWAVGDGSLYTLDDTGWHKLSLTVRGRDARVRQVYLRRNGDVLAGTYLGTFERTARTGRFERISSYVSWGMTEDADGTIWTTDMAHGFRRIDEPPSTEHAAAGYRVAFDRDGHLWVATYGAGLWRVSVEQVSGRRLIARAGLRTGLSSGVIQAVLEDRDGNIWVGTSGGLHRLTRRRLTPLEALGYVIAVAPDGRGGMWVGTTTGVLRFAHDAGRWGPPQVVSRHPDVRSLYDDRRGTLWVGAADGLYRLVAGRLLPMALPSRTRPQITSISPAADGSLWLTDGAWLFRWDGRRLIPFDLVPDAASVGRVTYVRMDRTGRLWIAFDSGRLGVVSANGTFNLLGPAEGFDAHLNDVIHAVSEDSDGNVWIGRSTGLGRLKNGRLPAGRPRPDQASVASAHVIGAKFGGSIAMQFAADYPQRTRTLAVVSGPVSRPSISSAPSTPQGARLGSEAPKEQVDYWNAMMAAANREASQGAGRVLQAMNLEPILSRIAAPTLVITSDRSPLQSVEAVMRYQAEDSQIAPAGVVERRASCRSRQGRRVRDGRTILHSRNSRLTSYLNSPW